MCAFPDLFTCEQSGVCVPEGKTKYLNSVLYSRGKDLYLYLQTNSHN